MQTARLDPDGSLSLIKANRGNSLDSLSQISTSISNANVEIRDVQFLFNRNGRFFVNDPEKIIKANAGGSTQVTLQRIDELMAFIQGI